MKRAKGFIIMATIATLAFGSVVAYGAETATTTTTTTKAAAAKTYDDLSVSNVGFQNDRAEDLGVYPKISGMDSLNTKIADTVFKTYLELGTTADDDYSVNHYLVSYTVQNDGRYAKVTVNRGYKSGYTNVHNIDSSLLYYVDKETMTEMTEADYKKALEDAAKPAETTKPTETAKPAETTKPTTDAKETTEAAKEGVLGLPVATYGKQLGFTVDYVEQEGIKMISVVKGDFNVVMAIGKNLYIVNGEQPIELDAAPEILEDGKTYVPVSFFEKILGYKYLGNDTFEEIAAGK